MKLKMLMAVLLGTTSLLCFAQSAHSPVRKGCVLGAAVGASAIALSYPDGSPQHELALTFPNFKLGAMLNHRMALLLNLAGTVYTYRNSGRVRARGFEGIVPSAQYWIQDRWWIAGGVGLGMDAPAFYDIRNEAERKFYFGLGGLMETGYELLRRGSFVMDAQARVYLATMKVGEESQQGAAFSMLVGINLY